MAKERTATLKGSDTQIKVYKSSIRNTWINSNNCTTEYKEDELIFNSY